jgi:hypothetical protein
MVVIGEKIRSYPSMRVPPTRGVPPEAASFIAVWMGVSDVDDVPAAAAEDDRMDAIVGVAMPKANAAFKNARRLR